MNKLILILMTIVIVTTGLYFIFTKNDITSVQIPPTTNEQQNTEPIVSPQQNTQIKTPTQTTTPKPVKPTTNNSGTIPQPPKFPE